MRFDKILLPCIPIKLPISWLSYNLRIYIFSWTIKENTIYSLFLLADNVLFLLLLLLLPFQLLLLLLCLSPLFYLNCCAFSRLRSQPIGKSRGLLSCCLSEKHIGRRRCKKNHQQQYSTTSPVNWMPPTLPLLLQSNVERHKVNIAERRGAQAAASLVSKAHGFGISENINKQIYIFLSFIKCNT